MEVEQEKLSVNAVIRYLLLIVVGIILVYPLFWMIASSFKTNEDIFGSLSLIPKQIVSANILNAWNITKNPATGETVHTILYYFANTLKFLIPKTFFTIVSCSLTAYVISRKKFRGQKVVFTAVIVTLLMPEIAFRIPLYLLFAHMGLINHFSSLYIQDIFASSSFFIFMIIQFMRTIPRELDEAALIDGCNDLQILTRILIPVIKPIIITVGLLCFMWGMNDFQGPLIYLNKPEQMTLSLILKQQLDGDTVVEYGKVFAASLLALLPMIALFFAGSRYFVDGVANTGGKE
jgi:oligogalacturonide transport system permease protein